MRSLWGVGEGWCISASLLRAVSVDMVVVGGIAESRWDISGECWCGWVGVGVGSGVDGYGVLLLGVEEEGMV